MNKLVKRIIGATSACALVLGMVFGANALAKKGEGKVEVNKNLPALTFETWFNNELVDSDPTNPANYKLTPKFECGDKKQEVCSISAPDNGSGQPDMSHPLTTGTVESQILASISTPTPTINSTVLSLRSNQ